MNAISKRLSKVHWYGKYAKTAHVGNWWKSVFELLDLSTNSNKTISIPTIDYWVGSPDANKFDEGKTVVDIKCPITLNHSVNL